jgi:uncharacterized Ntn-hydrolase superfamily protein
MRLAPTSRGTFSIVAADPGAGDWGVAVASKFPAVGAVVPWARAGVGAIATQAYANTSFGPAGLALLERGLEAGLTLRELLEGDPDHAHRQVGLADAGGMAATFTGEKCMDWAGGRTGDGFACQGNILVGPNVVDGMAEAFRASGGELVDRLLAALEAGDASGGDRRGKQSAALLVVRAAGGYGGRNDRYIDLRVDDHEDPVTELRRVFTVYDREYLIRQDPLLALTPELVTDIQRRLAATGHYQGEASGEYDDATRRALDSFGGEYNLEGKIRTDQQVYESLVRELRDITPEIATP